MKNKGTLPALWSVERMDQICSSVRDGTHDTPKPVSEGKPLITSKHIKLGRVDLTDAYLISPADHEAINKRSQVHQWDVLVSMIGTVGEIALVKEPPEYAIKNVGLLKAGDPILANWLYHYLKSPSGQAAITTYLSGTSQAFISLGSLRRLPVILPPSAEQQKIAAILTAYDDLIENNRQRIALLEEMAEEIYREWFVRLRFPGHEHTPVHKGVPDGWEPTRIGDMYQTMAGGTPSRSKAEYFGGLIPWVKTGELKQTFIFQTDEKISQLGLENSAAKLLPAGTVVMAMYCAMEDVTILATDAATNQACCALRPKFDYLGSEFTFHLVRSAMKELTAWSHDAAQQNLSQTLIKAFAVFNPDEALVTKYGDAVKPIFAAVKNATEQNAKLCGARDLLLNRLISGKLRVDDLDIQFPSSMQEVKAA